MYWNSLPVEVQTHILETLVIHGGSARYASVCRAWQIIIEQRLFARLRVTRLRLADFSDIGYRHRHLVKYIWLSIEPSEYHYPYQCPHCGGVAANNWHHVPSKTIRKAIQDLVIQFSRWEPSGSLLLDISVKAPSGLMHSSSFMQYGPPVIPEPKKDKVIQCSHWLHDRNLQEVAASLTPRTTNVSEPEPKPSRKIPKARAVTSLLLRRQTRRLWKSEALEELLELLPEVHEIQYEPWRDWRRMYERPTNTGKARNTLP